MGVGDSWSGMESTRIDQADQAFIFRASAAEEWRLSGKVYPRPGSRVRGRPKMGRALITRSRGLDIASPQSGEGRRKTLMVLQVAMRCRQTVETTVIACRRSPPNDAAWPKQKH